jgi:FHS family L-fucose permease-like MFS transporter
MRLSLAGGINNVGTTIGPVIVSFAIFGGVSNPDQALNLGAVQIPYLVLGFAFIVAAVFFKFSSVPDRIGDSTESAGAGILETIKHPQVLLGMIAIFVYVGVEVSTASNLPEFMKQKLGTPESAVAPYVSLFWASLMIGRWTSAAGAFDLSDSTKLKLSLLLPFAAFGVFAFANVIGGHSVQELYPYLLIVVILAVADAVSEGKPARQLILYSILGIAALLIGIFSSGMTSVFAFISVGLFCSTLWPCIFTLGIAGLGEKTNTASSLLIMMIMGGGVISLTQGALANDKLLGIQYSYFVGVVCFAYLAFFAVYVGRLLQKQGVSFEQGSSSGH